MNKNEKYSELLGFVYKVAKEKCMCAMIGHDGFVTYTKDCLSCQAAALLRKVMEKEDS